MKISLWRHNALVVEDGAFSHKMDCAKNFKEILNLNEHPNYITGTKVTVILLNGWILLIGGASSVKVLRLQPAQQACFVENTLRLYFLCTAFWLAFFW